MKSPAGREVPTGWGQRRANDPMLAHHYDVKVTEAKAIILERLERCKRGVGEDYGIKLGIERENYCWTICPRDTVRALFTCAWEELKPKLERTLAGRLRLPKSYHVDSWHGSYFEQADRLTDNNGFVSGTHRDIDWISIHQWCDEQAA